MGTGWSGRRVVPGNWKTLRVKVLERAGGKCEALGCTATATEVDHLTPVAEGGTHDLDNLAALCPAHHARKTKAEAARGRARYQAARPSPRRGREPHPGSLL